MRVTHCVSRAVDSCVVCVVLTFIGVCVRAHALVRDCVRGRGRLVACVRVQAVIAAACIAAVLAVVAATRWLLAQSPCGRFMLAEHEKLKAQSALSMKGSGVP
eukprot:SAG11_NODE_8210_length_1046_cov_1.501584_1_plen_103_part_00